MQFGLSKLHLVDGAVVEPPLDGMTVFTGPNNSGKSLLLRELVQQLQVHPGQVEPLRWINAVEIYREGSGEELIAWLESRGHEARRHPQTGRRHLPAPYDSSEPGPDIDAAIINWSRTQVGPLNHMLVSTQWTQDRLANQTESRQWDLRQPPSHPTQKLWEDRATHTRFSQWFEDAFGKPIAINRFIPEIRLQVGSTGLADTAPPITPELREAYSALPYLAEQGDGMRAFANIMLHTLVTPPPVIVIDEPEAFLHPPQARLLGRYLAMYAPSQCQVFVATHSADFLHGVLEGNANIGNRRPLSLVRISRVSGVPESRILSPEVVSDILDTPLLRYSHIISGLFHDGVVLCEAEGDCAFYAATFDAVRGTGQHGNLAFLHVNGKARLSDAAQKLRACGIPTAVIADLDFLNDSAKIRQALTALGGEWDRVKHEVRTLQEHASSSVISSPASEIKKEIASIIGNASGRIALSQHQIDKITELLKTANGWKILKSSGLTGLSGDPHNAARHLLEYFASLGVFLVPVGELECWVRTIPGSNKSAWLTRVLDEGHHQNPSNELQEFTARIVSYLKQ
ncbi:AAA family ATPase [Streptomyces longwoodensis]|uniref:ATP-dependent nuclease n=1 Tax=Streptomyces longwoodensis TaxID=68231 RepID=UPI0033B85C41